MENSIGHYLRGGLGNQLFQVFTLISKSIDINKDFYILHDINDKRPLYELIFFNIRDKITQGAFHINYNQPNYYYEKNNRSFDEIPDDIIFIGGHFENHLYFDHNRDKIISKLKINELQTKYKFNFKKIIAIHFRFEDNIDANYIQHPNHYINCLNILKDELKEDFYNHKFIIFTTKGNNDDYLTDRYIYHINVGLETPIEFLKFKDLYPNIKTEEEFIYLSNCNHIISSLSTFSWFAYYLSNYNDKRLFISNSQNTNYNFFNLKGITLMDNCIISTEELFKL